MELCEAIAVIHDFMTEDPLCEGKDEPQNQGWKCRVGDTKTGDLAKPTAKLLLKNMKNDGKSIPDMPGKKAGSWDLGSCGPSTFPFQSHHLIPKMHLPKHDVCVWLSKKTPGSKWKLTESTNYDTDDSRNGLPLPFVSTTHQWKKSKSIGNQKLKEKEQSRICNEMMSSTQKQLHQGQHTYDDYDGGEEENLHASEAKGYLGAVDELLGMVNHLTLQHVQFCDDCKKSNSPPIEVRPLKRIELSMHQVSHCMESMIDTNNRYVSKRASEYWKSRI